MRSRFERPPVFKFTIGDRVTIADHIHLRAVKCEKKEYEQAYPEGLMVVDLRVGIHGPDYHCESLAKEPAAAAMWIDEKYLKELDTV